MYYYVKQTYQLTQTLFVAHIVAREFGLLPAQRWKLKTLHSRYNGLLNIIPRYLCDIVVLEDGGEPRVPSSPVTSVT